MPRGLPGHAGSGCACGCLPGVAGRWGPWWGSPYAAGSQPLRREWPEGRDSGPSGSGTEYPSPRRPEAGVPSWGSVSAFSVWPNASAGDRERSRFHSFVEAVSGCSEG